MLVLNRSQVEDLLDLDELIDALAPAMADLSAGRAYAPDRVGSPVPEHGGLLAAMPGYVPSTGSLVTKLVTLFPGNAGSALPTHQAVIVAFAPETGEPTAFLDGEAITAMRTAACSALSARLLSRPESSVLAVLGTGVQARAHAEAMLRVRPITSIRVAGRDLAKAQALAASLPNAVAVTSYEEAVAGADIVCAATHATSPVVRRSWLSPGTHVTSVGFNGEGTEVDADTVADALVCVEARAGATAGYPVGSRELEGMPGDSLVELGEIVTGAAPGRQSTDQITLYKSVGVAVQDAVAAGLVIAAAAKRGVGTQLQ